MNKQSKIISGAFAGVAAIALTLFSINNTSAVQHGPHYHKVTKGSDGGVFITSANAGDTFALSANDNPFSYVYVGGVNGTATDSITLINQDGQVFLTQGIKIENSTYVSVDGTGYSDVQYGFKCTNNKGRVPGVIVGKCDYISWHDCEFFNYGTGTGIFWDKTEMVDAEQQKNPLNYVYPNGMYHHNIYNNYFHGSGGDLYLGSTGFGNPGQPGRDAFHFNGTITYPKPMRIGDINFHDNIVDSLGRSFQISGCDTLGAHVWNNTFTHLGYEYNTSQGAIAFGGGDKDVEFDHNIVDYTFLNFYSYAYGKVKVHDNSFDHADLFDNNGGKNTNPQANASCLINGQGQPTKLLFYNNQIGYSNNDVQLVIYNKLDPASCISGVTKLVNHDNASFGSCSISDTTVQDTTAENPVIDSSIIKVDIIFHYKNGKTFSPTGWKRITINKKGNYVLFYYDSSRQILKDSINVDTSTSNSATKTSIGISPFKVANDYGVVITRDAYQLEYFSNATATSKLIERFNSYGTLLLNINHYSGVFTDDPGKHADSIKAIADKVKFAVLVDENEEMQPEKHKGSTVKQYCDQLVADANVYPGRVANGGFTMPLFLWYYANSHDTDFAKKCLPSLKINDYTRVTDQQTILDTIKAHRIIANIHFYLNDTAQIACIIRMIKFAQNYLGPQVFWICNEAGIYKQDPLLIKGLVTIARDVHLRDMIMYCSVGNISTGPYQALPISKDDFEKAIN